MLINHNALLHLQLDMTMDGDYCRVITPEMPMNDEVEEVCTMINEMMNMRAKWLFKVGWGSLLMPENIESRYILPLLIG